VRGQGERPDVDPGAIGWPAVHGHRGDIEPQHVRSVLVVAVIPHDQQRLVGMDRLRCVADEVVEVAEHHRVKRVVHAELVRPVVTVGDVRDDDVVA
jgi:hypothetical protein